MKETMISECTIFCGLEDFNLLIKTTWRFDRECIVFID